MAARTQAKPKKAQIGEDLVARVGHPLEVARLLLAAATSAARGSTPAKSQASIT